MAITSSGQIKISDIVTEFGGSAPHAMSEYYRNGANVPGNNTNVPTSGQISLTQFYSAVNEIVIVLTNNATNLNASTLFGTNYTSSVPKRLTVANDVEIGATSGNNVLTIPSGMAGTLILDNAGTISGYGGAAGSAGGNSIRIEVAGVTINNSGTIRAGGGGGGTGGTGGTGGNGSETTEGSFTGSSTGSCSYGASGFSNVWITPGNCGSPSSGFFNGNQACAAAHGGQYTGAAGSGSQGLTIGQSQGTGNYAWGFGLSSPKYWRVTGYWRFDNQGCSIVSTSSTSGGAGGAGGAGGVAEGFNQSAASGSGGSGGSGGGTNAGSGGTGGTGGTGGSFGNSGATGSTGATGSNGNSSNGSAGSSGGAGGAAGYYLSHSGGISSTMNNTGTLTGQSG